jgi:hypothetical protein
MTVVASRKRPHGFFRLKPSNPDSSAMKARLNNPPTRKPTTSWKIHSLSDTAGPALALLLTLGAADLTRAQQTVTVQSQPIRVTVPDISTNTTTLTNQVNFGGTGSDPVNLSLSGLPAGVGYSFDVSSFAASGPASLTLFTTNVPKGEHVLGINATGGASNSFLLTLQSGRMWTGDTNIVGNWSAASSWVGGIIPGPADDVLFTQVGAQSDATFTNSIVDTDLTIASLTFSQTNGNARYHRLEIQPSRTLTVTGAGGLRLLRDYSNVGNQMDVNITGGGKLVVSNASANVAVQVPNQVGHRLDLSGLGAFVADVNRVVFGDYRAFPNYTNLTANGFGGNATYLIPRRFTPTVSLARTNIIRATHVDPNDYMHPAIRDYSLTLANNEVGTTADAILQLGLSNAFFMDSLCFVQSSAQSDPTQGGIRFNAAFTASNPVVYLRGTNGGRMTVWAIGDQAGVGPSGTGTKAIVNFNPGTIDAMIDRLYLSRDRTNSSDGATAEATLSIARGTLNVNTAILGFQGQGNNQNETGADRRSYARGTLNVSTAAVFVVNQTLELGHTTADPGHVSAAEDGYGQLNIRDGGKVMASTITVGGVTKVSRNNNITLTGGGILIVSNTLAGPEKRVTTLSMTDSTLVLHVNGAKTDPYVYVTNLGTIGSGNIIEFATVTNITSFPATIPILSYENATPTLTLKVPTGLSGYLQNNAGTKTIEAVLSSVTPKTVLWRGNQSATWDTSTLNWVDATTLTPTNFNNGDFVIFDDSATGSTSITVSGAVLSGQSTTVPGVTVSNVTKSYTFSGGTIAGTGTMLKQGAGSLTINSVSENPLILREGAVSGSGAIGSTTVSAGTALSFSGAISGLTSTGMVTLVSPGTISGGVAIRGGSFVNSGTVTTAPGTLAISSGASVTNQAAGIISIQGVSTVASNGVLANFGRINNLSDRMNVSGLLLGTGTVSDQTLVANGNQGRLAINAGATFSPGSSIGTFIVEGRLDLNQAAGGNPAGRLVIEVDMNHPQKNDVVGVDKWSNIRGTLVMTNIGTVPFAAGQSFLIVSNNFSSFGVVNTPEVANLDYTIQPATPGPGLQWDVSNLITNGIVAITGSPINPNPTNITVSVSGTNLTLSWPDSHLGWQLQVQTNQLTSGVSTIPTDWQTIANSENTNQVTVPIDAAKPTTFYRMVLP